MIWDNVFWLAFAASGLVAVYSLYAVITLGNVLMVMILICTGLCKISQESRKDGRMEAALSRRIIDRLKKG